MKKTVKSLIIAASVAAIAGIGAVSFAAWSGSSTKTESTGNQASGTVEAVGFAADTVITNTGKKLMPIDQASVDSETQAYYYAVALKTSGTDFTGYKITVKAEAVGDSVVPSGLKCAVLENAPTTGTGATLSGTWITLGGTTSAQNLVTSGLADNKTYNVYIVLDSDNSTYAANAGKNFKVTFELTSTT